jgi:tRNA nucleotidyltransferase (CCA-adding enzyme)
MAAPPQPPPLPPDLQANAWLVGGAVRDALMGQPVQDRDWVVVGATPQRMLEAGFRPVGRDFPVFLHPATQEEYALARTERKTAAGYHGFAFHASPEVTLEQDLARRDLTINAIAQHPVTGELVDPFGGQADLRAKVLRHVSPAFREDPVRLLRLARFAARLHDFAVAPETLAEMQAMVASGEANALVAERVWQELSRGLMQARPSRMLAVLRASGALAVLLPEVNALYGVPQPPAHHPEVDTGVHLELVLDMAAQLQAPLEARFACLCHDLGKGSTPRDEWPRHIGHEGRSERLAQALCERWRVPNDCRELALLTAREHTHVHRSGELRPQAVWRLLQRCDALRRPGRFAGLLLACEADARGRTGLEDRPYPQRERLARALALVQAVDVRAVAEAALARGVRGPGVGDAVDRARQAALTEQLDPRPDPGAAA